MDKTFDCLKEYREEFAEDLKQIWQLVSGKINECTVNSGALLFLYRQNCAFARPNCLDYEIPVARTYNQKIHLSWEDWAGDWADLQYEVEFGASEGIYLNLFHKDVDDGKQIPVATIKTLYRDRDSWMGISAYGAALCWSAQQVASLAYSNHYLDQKLQEKRKAEEKKSIIEAHDKLAELYHAIQPDADKDAIGEQVVAVKLPEVSCAEYKEALSVLEDTKSAFYDWLEDSEAENTAAHIATIMRLVEKSCKAINQLENDAAETIGEFIADTNN